MVRLKEKIKLKKIYLRHFVNNFQDDWARHLTLEYFCLKIHVSASSGVTPFFASIGGISRLYFLLGSEVVTSEPNSHKTPEILV